LKQLLLEGNTLPNSNYEAKKILCPMGMEYKKIHASPNDCILYRNEFEFLKNCPRCGLSRYKLKDKDEDSIQEMTKHGSPMKVKYEHISWSVLLVIYILLPTLYMKRKYMMLFMMISSPRQSGNYLNVYLSP